MKHCPSILILTLATLMATTLQAQTLNLPAVDQQTTARLRQLEKEKAGLEQQVSSLRQTRLHSQAGATPEVWEAYNLQQDSLCLDLQSQITDKVLQIEAITRPATSRPAQSRRLHLSASSLPGGNKPAPADSTARPERGASGRKVSPNGEFVTEKHRLVE